MSAATIIPTAIGKISTPDLAAETPLTAYYQRVSTLPKGLRSAGIARGLQTRKKNFVVKLLDTDLEISG